jgi:hypothetical protein
MHKQKYIYCQAVDIAFPPANFPVGWTGIRASARSCG